jgi:hypothetical protein
VLAGFRLPDTEFGVLSAFPVDHQHDLARCIIDVGDDAGDQGTHQTLPRSHGGARRTPGSG